MTCSRMMALRRQDDHIELHIVAVSDAVWTANSSEATLVAGTRVSARKLLLATGVVSLRSREWKRSIETFQTCCTSFFQLLL